MAPKVKAEEVAVLDLILAEMAEQETWQVSIPLWHPRNEGDGDAGGDDGDGSGDGDGDDDGGSGEGTPTEAEKAQAAVDAAYAKLRAAEKERDDFKAKATKLERQGLGDLERAKAEAEDARLEAASLQEQIDNMNRDKLVASVATSMKFRNVAVASRFVNSDSKDERAIRNDLKAALKDIPELAGEGNPPPPINNGGDTGGSQNSRMNAALRAAAGRR